MDVIGHCDLWGLMEEIGSVFACALMFSASAHGRPDGMPGRIVGARAKALRFQISDLKLEYRDFAIA